MTASHSDEDESQETHKLSAETRHDAVLSQLSIVTDNLETYAARDALIALMHYIALILADFCSYFSLGNEQNLSDNFVNMFGKNASFFDIPEYPAFKTPYPVQIIFFSVRGTVCNSEPIFLKEFCQK